MGVSVEHIYTYLREGKGSRDSRDDCNNIQRKHFITKRQIREIARELKVNKHFHEIDRLIQIKISSKTFISF